MPGIQAFFQLVHDCIPMHVYWKYKPQSTSTHAVQGLGGSNTSAILHRDEARETDRLTDVRKKTDDVSVVTDKTLLLEGVGGGGNGRRTEGRGGSKLKREEDRRGEEKWE